MVSNHGGRQLDGVEATIDALPAIVKGGLISESFFTLALISINWCQIG